MSIEREHFNGPITFRCDGPKCHEFDETHCENFGGALAKIKSHGWIIRVATRGGAPNDFQHICPDCQP